MKKILTLAAALLVQLSVTAQQKVHEIPFVFHKEGHLHIQVQLEGQEQTATFIFDTGGRNIINTARFGEEISRKPASIKLGDFTIHEPVFVKDDYSKRFPEFYHDMGGMLGPEIFEGYIIQIDYNQQLIRVAENAEAFKGTLGIPVETVFSRTPLPLRIFGLMPRFAIELKWQSREINEMTFTLDTGSPLRFVHHIRHMKQYDKKKPFLQNAAIDTVKNNSYSPYGRNKAGADAYMIQFAELESGELVLADQEVKFSPTGMLTVGNGFLKNYLVTIDLQEQKVYLKEQRYNPVARAE